MVYEPWRPCNHNMGPNETEILKQIPGLLSNKGKEGGAIQNDAERRRESGGLCREATIQSTKIQSSQCKQGYPQNYFIKRGKG